MTTCIKMPFFYKSKMNKLERRFSIIGEASRRRSRKTQELEEMKESISRTPEEGKKLYWFSKIYGYYKKVIIKHTVQFELKLNLSEDYDMTWELIKYKLPCMKSITIWFNGHNIKNNDVVYDLLGDAFPDSVESVHLWFPYMDEENIAYYIPSLIDIKDKITKKLKIERGLIRINNFQLILETFSHCRYLSFKRCNFIEPKINYPATEKEIKFKIKELKFCRSENLNYTKVMNIFLGLGGNLNLKSSLETISLYKIKLSDEEIEEIFQCLHTMGFVHTNINHKKREMNFDLWTTKKRNAFRRSTK